MNDALRRAMAAARLTDADVAARVGVDPKTVRRWLAGRTPHPRHRWAVVDLVGEPEYRLWPEVEAGTQPLGVLNNGVLYPHRWAVPRDVWLRHFESAEKEIAILVYSGLFLAEDAGILAVFERKALAGVMIRILLGDPSSPQVEHRGDEERIGDAMSAKVRNALVLYLPILDEQRIQIRLHRTVLYNSLYRVDERLLVNQHVYGVPAASSPVFEIDGRRSGELAKIYIDSFEKVWELGVPFPV
ncbi:helix-turn-helix domain-containing protein [Allonocardiopsis opalescens]|uniref:Helix-turn-helix protein n=1 Tax=Allonocardiopsis opalescens TaxID=1144618 RepID=A0A2T0Q358_9ACTN|nr:helix-turn-helix domain-containing protein [Allonocardiopsis opalescens]PRX98160.1 helix-turn-helix protein [Allonocardiopsis opalescens]